MTKLFDNISFGNKGKLLNLLRAHSFTFDENTTILSTIKNENIIGIIDEGEVHIISSNYYNGETTIIERLEKDDILGSMFFPIEKDDYEIIAKSKTKITVIDFKNIIDSNIEKNNHYYNQFINNLLSIQTEKLKERNERIDILSKKTIRNKLLEYFEIKSNNRITKNIYLPYSFMELSSYLAVDRAAMHRELKHLQEEGLIEIKNKKITLKY